MADSLDLRQRMDEIDDALRLTRAEPSGELALLRGEAEKNRDTRKLALSEFYDNWSELLWEQARLAEFRMKLKKLKPIHREGAVSDERIESLQFQMAERHAVVETAASLGVSGGHARMSSTHRNGQPLSR